MRKWAVNASVVGGIYLGTFEAETEDEAIKMALKKNGFVSLCHQCADRVSDLEIEDPRAEEVNA